MCLRVDSNPKVADEHHFGLSVKPTGNFIYTVDRNVVDICQVLCLFPNRFFATDILFDGMQAKMDSSVTCILYVTMPSGEPGSRIFLQPIPEISGDQEFIESPIYNAHWGGQFSKIYYIGSVVLVYKC